jgi:hypothetical protein
VLFLVPYDFCLMMLMRAIADHERVRLSDGFLTF